jgi:cyclophilin family peptidyl-prolyl cis-trans isomerase
MPPARPLYTVPPVAYHGARFARLPEERFGKMSRFLQSIPLALAWLVFSTVASPVQAKPAARKDADTTGSPSPMALVEKAAGHPVEVGSRIEFKTAKGAFTAVLFPKEAPKTVANFEKLVKKGFYDGLTFHRVIPGFVAQGGDPRGDGSGGPGWSIPDELSSTCKHLRGSLAMAKSSAPDSAGSQFYIAFEPLPFLDGRYTVFGQVVEGMNVVDKIEPTEGPLAKGKTDRMIRVRIKR